jgi:hypothetical protein
MKLFLPEDKINRVIKKCRELLEKRICKIQQVAEVLGNIVAATPATKYGLLYTRQLESEKTQALSLNFGN